MVDEAQGNPAPEEQTQEPEEQMPDLAGFLSAFEGSPTQDQIEAWKSDHGEIFCSGFTETELYIWRPLTRREYVAMQVELAQSEEPVTAFTVEEKVVGQCVLWGSGPGLDSLERKAGSLSTLHEQIMQNSNFMNPAMASALVIKL